MRKGTCDVRFKEPLKLPCSHFVHFSESEVSFGETSQLISDLHLHLLHSLIQTNRGFSTFPFSPSVSFPYLNLFMASIFYLPPPETTLSLLFNSVSRVSLPLFFSSTAITPLPHLLAYPSLLSFLLPMCSPLPPVLPHAPLSSFLIF